mmetsp:Transcript_8846/g.16280  ORF Transcript_8846/g.16280 Transcript_8846/m.16280 type:complete len:218 (-) Transcript_8846:190-843(-)
MEMVTSTMPSSSFSSPTFFSPPLSPLASSPPLPSSPFLAAASTRLRILPSTCALLRLRLLFRSTSDRITLSISSATRSPPATTPSCVRPSLQTTLWTRTLCFKELTFFSFPPGRFSESPSAAPRSSFMGDAFPSPCLRSSMLPYSPPLFLMPSAPPSPFSLESSSSSRGRSRRAAASFSTPSRYHRSFDSPLWPCTRKQKCVIDSAPSSSSSSRSVS